MPMATLGPYHEFVPLEPTTNICAVCRGHRQDTNHKKAIEEKPHQAGIKLRDLLWTAIMNGTKSGTDERLRLLSALNAYKGYESITIEDGQLPNFTKIEEKPDYPPNAICGKCGRLREAHREHDGKFYVTNKIDGVSMTTVDHIFEPKTATLAALPPAPAPKAPAPKVPETTQRSQYNPNGIIARIEHLEDEVKNLRAYFDAWVESPSR